MSLITNVNDTPQHYFRIEGIQKPRDYCSTVDIKGGKPSKKLT